MKDIKGIILAGGQGTRLYPLTKVTNKHLLPIAGEPMIYYPLRRLVSAGIKDIMIITGVEHSSGVTSLLGSGKENGCNLTYRVQDQPDGIGGALRLCREFVGDSSCVVLLGDNIFKEDLKPHIEEFQSGSNDCMVFFKRVSDPRRYGIGVFDEERLISIEEKPVKPKTNLACVGIYFYTNKVFDAIDRTNPSGRGEYEITSVNNVFIENNKCSHATLKEWWSDAGTMNSYHTTNWVMYKER
jgi:glucose-1-phosphate thymidylyltransferase